MNKRSLIIITIISASLFLRLYKLGTIPIGLYSDEASLGYNAYSLLKTGRDEFGNKWPLTLKSFGDYKPPMSAWLDIPSVFLLGLNEFSVRLPSVLAGTLTVLIVYFTVKEIFTEEIENSKFFKFLPAISTLLIAISPWHILFTRSNMLIGEEIMFTSAGFLFFLKGLKKKYYFFLSSFSFSVATYSYYGARITIILLLVILLIIFRRELYLRRKNLILPLMLGLIMLLPLIYSIIKNPLTITGRAKTISIFYDQHISEKLWEAHTMDGPNYPVVLSRFFNNKPYLYLNDIVKRYLQHYSFDFLAVTGDTQTPFNLEKMGVTYIPSFFFFLFGLYFSFRKMNKKILALLSYLFVSPVAASFTFITPAANRSFNMVIAFSILEALGTIIFIRYIKNIIGFKTSITAVALLYLVSFLFFTKTYFITIPQHYSNLWHYGRKELIEKISKVENDYTNVVVSDSQGPAYIWFLFYKKYDPDNFSKSYTINNVPDQFGFINITSFSNYHFIKPFSWENEWKDKNTLYIGFEDDIPDLWIGVQEGKHYTSSVIDKVQYPNGKTAFKLIKINSL